MGEHSGYDRLFSFLKEDFLESSVSLFRSPTNPNWFQRRQLNKFLWNLRPSDLYTYASAFVEKKASDYCHKHPECLVHIAYLEQNYALLSEAPKETILLATAHQPPSWWKLNFKYHSYLKRLNGIVTMSQDLAEYLSQYTDAKIIFIPHGVDTDFFKPSPFQHERPFKIMFSGQWLRDFSMLERVVEYCCHNLPLITFEILIPRWARNDAQFFKIARYKNTNWRSELSDSQLVDLYNSCSLLFMPVLDCTANNAVLESASCGLPLIGYDIPAFHDYTSKDFAQLVDRNNFDSIVETIEALSKSNTRCLEAGNAARTFAEEHLSWSGIAEKTQNFFSSFEQ